MIGSRLRASAVLMAMGSLALSCAAGDSTLGGGPVPDAGKSADGGRAVGSNDCVPSPEVCGDGIDNDCNGLVDDGFDLDGDGVLSCAGDCDDHDAAVHQGATETANGKDDDCDGKIDNHIAGVDFDKDGTPYPQDCNDDEPLVGPLALEVAGDGVDNNCNGQVDEAVPDCDGALTGLTAEDFAKAIGLCSNVIQAQFVVSPAGSHAIRSAFGTNWKPKQGSKLAMFSTGLAKDGNEAYSPQPGAMFSTEQAHPLPSPSRCGTAPSKVYDMTELKLTVKVPQNANSFSYQVNFFSAEYPEYVCTQFNDRFIAILESAGLDKTKLPADQCLTGTAKPSCNISYDHVGQPITINNGFFDVCVSASGSGWSNACTQSPALLAKTGYESPDPVLGHSDRIVGGATGWLTTKAPVVPGETITLRFIIFDEGDHKLDSAVLIDNFKWDVSAVAAPTTEPTLN